MIRTKIALIVAATLALSACGPGAVPTNKDRQADKAAEAAATIDFTANAEIDNIAARHRLTSRPGAIGYIILMNQSGQIVFYGSVRGKVTSSGKRLTPPDQMRRYPSLLNDVDTYAVGPAPSDEGTWGSSDPYIYFWTTDGQYMQWNGSYLYSNSPIRLSVQPLVVSMGAPSERVVPAGHPGGPAPVAAPTASATPAAQ
jgi:hypothetical protein